MTILEQILNSTADGSIDIGTNIRKCRILAEKLGNRQLEDWFIWESEGYPGDVALPDYRIWPLGITADFFNAAGGFKNMPVSAATLPEPSKTNFRDYKCRQSIVGIESLLSEAAGSTIDVESHDLFIVIDSSITTKGNKCVSARAHFSKQHLIELVNSVRNRLLSFAIELSREHIEIDSPDFKKDDAKVEEKISQITSMTIYGGQQNIVGIAKDSELNFNVVSGNFDSLKELLVENGVSSRDVVELEAALAADGQPESSGAYGPKVSSWFGKMMKKAAGGGWTIGAGAAGSLLAQALSRYYGFS